MQEITLKAPAKINLSLDVLGKLPNGYHSLSMIMQTISLFDSVTLTRDDSTPGIVLECDFPYVPNNSKNIAWKAAEVFYKKFGPGGVRIHIEKKIPVAAGLAGGSADAAAVLNGLNTLYGSPFGIDELSAMGLTLGADVPYCLHGGTCLAEGVGEKLTVLDEFKGFWLVLIKPPFPVSTPWVFKNLDLSNLGERPNNLLLIEAMRAKDVDRVGKLMKNVLESVTIKVHPEIERIRMDLLNFGAVGSRMSGSGPSTFGFFENEAKAVTALAKMKRHYSESWVVQTLT